MEKEEKTRVIREKQKAVHFDCDIALYKNFKAICNKQGKTVSACLRAYMKMYAGEN